MNSDLSRVYQGQAGTTSAHYSAASAYVRHSVMFIRLIPIKLYPECCISIYFLGMFLLVISILLLPFSSPTSATNLYAHANLLPKYPTSRKTG